MVAYIAANVVLLLIIFLIYPRRVDPTITINIKPMSKHKLLVCKSCHRSSEELADGQIADGSILLEQLNTLSKTGCNEQLQSELLEIEPVECLWACSRGCVVAVNSAKKPTYLFADISPEENAITALLDFMKLYIKSSKGVIAWKNFPEILQPAIVAVIPSVTAD